MFTESTVSAHDWLETHPPMHQVDILTTKVNIDKNDNIVWIICFPQNSSSQGHGAPSELELNILTSCVTTNIRK